MCDVSGISGGPTLNSLNKKKLRLKIVMKMEVKSLMSNKKEDQNLIFRSIALRRRASCQVE